MVIEKELFDKLTARHWNIQIKGETKQQPAKDILGLYSDLIRESVMLIQ